MEVASTQRSVKRLNNGYLGGFVQSEVTLMQEYCDAVSVLRGPIQYWCLSNSGGSRMFAGVLWKFLGRTTMAIHVLEWVILLKEYEYARNQRIPYSNSA